MTTKFSIKANLKNQKGDIATLILREDNGVCSFAYLYSFDVTGKIIDTLKIMDACDNGDLLGPDFDYFYKLFDNVITINYRVLTPVKPTIDEPNKTHKITKYSTYVRVLEHGYFFELSNLESSKNERRFKETSYKLITKEELNSFTKDELAIMRNEIFASHGYIFNSDRYKFYFEEQLWYKPMLDNVLDKLSDIEKENIKLIQLVENI